MLIPLDTLPVLFNACVIYFLTNLRPGMEFFMIYFMLLAVEFFVGECTTVPSQCPRVGGSPRLPRGLR